MLIAIILLSASTSTPGIKPYKALSISSIKGREITSPPSSSTVPDLVIHQTPLPTVKVLFDESHGQWWDSEKLSAFLQDLEENYGVEIVVHTTGELNDSLLSNYDVLIITNPSVKLPYNATEIDAIKNFVNSGGALLIMGDWYDYFDPACIENITKDYGIGWYDAEILDESNHDYYKYLFDVIIHTWANNTVARFVSRNGTFEVEAYSSTALYWTGVNSTDAPVYIVGTGDDDTIVKFENDTQKTLGYDAIAFMAVDVVNGGRIFASGSSAMFRSDEAYYYLDTRWDTADFAMLVFEWLLGRGLWLSSTEAPSSLLLSEHGLINLTITNNWGIDATNVRVGVEIEGALDLVNASNIYTIETLPAGSSVSLCWEVVATGNSLANVTIKVWSDNVPGFSKVVHIETLSLTVTLYPIPEEFLIYERDNFTLFVEVYNPTNIVAENISLELILPAGLSTLNDTTYFISALNPGEAMHLEYIIKAAKIGFFEIVVQFSSANLGSGSASTKVNVYNALIVFDEGHGQFYDSSRMPTFIKYLSQYGLVEINTGNFTEEILNAAHLVVIPYPNDGLYDFEISLLKNYLANGGKVWIMGNWYDYFDPASLNDLTGEYGIVWNDGEIMDDENNMDASYKPILSVFADNLLAKLLSAGVSSVLAHGCTYLNVTDPAIPILLGNPTSYGVNDTGKPSGINGTDLVAAAAVELENGGKLFAMGGTLPFAYTDNAEYNHRFIDNIIRWLIGSRALNDTSPPEISITAPGADSYIASQTVTIEWSVTDKTEGNITFVYLDDSLVDMLVGGETEYTLSDLSEGTHTVKLVVYDRAYLSSEATVTFTVDLTKPVVTILSPTENEVVKAGNITVTFEVTDNFGVDRVEVYLDGELVTTLPGTANQTTVNVPPGTHTISIVAYDFAGNQASALVTITAKAPPTIATWLVYIGGAVIIIIAIIVAVYYVKKKA